jgi:hypothetical protein
MKSMTVQELIQFEIAQLPEKLAREALDFILYLRERQSEEDFLKEQVEIARAYRRAHPDEVMTVTADEWEAATDPTE